MPRSLLLALFLFCGSCFLAQAAEEETNRIIAAGRGDSLVMEHLDFLCNRIGPRLTSSDNLQNACEWARERFASFGLENARLEEWGEFPVGFNRGPWSGRVVEPMERALEFTTSSWSAGTKGASRGKAILAPMNEEELAKVKDDLKGAWVFSPVAGRDGPRPDAKFLARLNEVYTEAGAAGVVRSARGELILTDGNFKVSWEKLPTLPAVRLLQKQFDEIVGWLREGKNVTVEFDVRNHFKKGPIKLYNVIADIPGAEKPDEYVIVGGHIDSWDGATGATDNGTGCATALEAARILMKAGVKPRRTIRFMLWSGEEQGLLGSREYVKAHPELTPKISAVLVHDGGTNYLSGIGATEAILSDFQRVFASVVNLDSDFPFVVRKVEGLRGGGSDHASFLAANVPGFFWGQQGGRARYNRTHHTQFDTYDAAIPEYQEHSSLVVALGAFGIADLDHLLSREKLRPVAGAAGGGGGNRRLLGVALDELTIIEVLDDGLAKKAGMKAGDVIAKLDGLKLVDGEELRTALQAGAAKKSVVVLRDGKEVEFTIDWTAPAPNP